MRASSFGAVAMALCAGLITEGVQSSFPDAAHYEQALTAWATVLREHVDRQGRVDFAGLRDNSGNLDSYLDCVADYGPLSSPRDFAGRSERLAYYLNAYNALAMRKVVDFGIPKKMSGFTKLHFFVLSRVDVSGKRMSLYTLENEYIRTARDPRIHFALNCMAVSCPRLPREPFAPKTLDVVLDRLAREFFAEQRNLRVDHNRKTVYVSEILEFYPEDFLQHAETLIDYINRYTHPDIPSSYSIQFIGYDWRVNRQTGGDY